MSVIDKINAQQNGKLLTDAWVVGEILKDMVREDSQFEKTLNEMIDYPSLNLENAAMMLKEYEDARKRRGIMSCVPLLVQEKILWDFYSATFPCEMNPAMNKLSKAFNMQRCIIVTHLRSHIDIAANRLEIRDEKLYVWAGDKLQLSVKLALCVTVKLTAESESRDK